ncbi:MAG: hypothetical protein ACRD1R_08855 [Acidobacteriota bacterium]
MPDPSEVKQISMSNTKKEMLAAYTELLKQFEERQEQKLNGEKKVEQRNLEEALKVADSLSTEGVVRGIGTLKAEIGSLLNQVSDRLEEQVSKLKAIQRAIEFKDKELREIYEIERSVGSLAALIDAQHQKRTSFQEEMATRGEELQQEIQSTRADWEREQEEHANRIAERNTEEARKRQREKEEFQYEFEREKKLARDQFEDERSRLQKELEAKRVELLQREEAVAALEQELTELRRRAEAFPEEKEAAVARALSEAVERIRSEAQNQQELMSKEFEGERKVFLTRIESLEKTIREQNQQITKLSQIQDKAYQQVQDIAVRAVEGASNWKSFPGFQQTGGEQKKRTAQEE